MAARKKPYKNQREWSDAQKIELLKFADAQPKGKMISALRERYQVNSGSWIATIRQKMLEKYKAKDVGHLPDLTAQPVQPPDPIPAVKLDVGPDFRSADDATKRKLLLNYRTLPNEGKAAFRKQHNMSQSLVSYYAARFGLTSVGTAQANGSAPPPTNIAALVAEYEAIPRKGKGKSAWLKEHGLNHQKIWEMKHRGQTPRSLVLSPIVQRRVHHEIEVPIAVPAHVVTLDDAINAMEVRRDLLDEFIGNLKRMRAGAAR